MVRRYRRKRYYSTLQRILVHLSSDGGFQRDRLSALTQEGIASAILSGRSTVTKCLDRLEKSGWIVGERAQVPGHRVRKTVYSLTKTGWRRAEDFRVRLGTDAVDVSAPDLDSLTVKVLDIPRVLPAPVELSTVLSLVREGRLDLSRAPRPMTKTTTAVLWGKTIPQIEKLVGRAGELGDLNTWMAGSSPVLVVTGIAGIGKSSLVAKWVLRSRRLDRVFWHEFGRSATIDAFISNLAEFLARLGRRGLSEYLTEKRPVDLELVARLLVHSLQDTPVLLVMDSCERVPSRTANQLMPMMVRVASEAGSRLIVISRQLSPVFHEGSNFAGAPRVLTIGPLDMESSVAMLVAKGQKRDRETLLRLAASTRGHPLLLNLVASAGMEAKRTMKRYLHEEIWKDLTSGERTSLEAASIFLTPAATYALTTMPGVSESALEKLHARNLLEQTLGGQVSVHELVRDFVRNRGDGARLRRLHFYAANYFLGRPAAQDHLEGVYHLIEADRAKEAARFIESSNSAFLDSASIREMASLVRKIDLGKLDPRAACVLSEFVGDGFGIAGQLDLALWQYRHAIRKCEQSHRLNRVPRLLRKIASIERRRGKYSRALDNLSAAKARLGPGSDLPESAEVLRELALVAQAQGDLSAASTCLDEAIDLATEASDLISMARSMLTLGTVECQRGNVERGLDYKLEGLRIAVRSGNLTETARGFIFVGTAYGEMSLFQKSLEHHEKALRLARMLGNVRLIAYAAMNSSAALIDLGRFDQAGVLLSEARSHFKILEERECLALLDIAEGNREMGLGRDGRARSMWHHGLQALRDLGDLGDLAVSLRDVGKLNLRHGDTAAAQAYLTEARETAHRLGNASLKAEMDELLSGITDGGMRVAAAPPESSS